MVGLFFGVCQVTGSWGERIHNFVTGDFFFFVWVFCSGRNVDGICLAGFRGHEHVIKWCTFCTVLNEGISTVLCVFFTPLLFVRHLLLVVIRACWVFFSYFVQYMINLFSGIESWMIKVV